MATLHQDITSFILKAFYNTYNKLGYGFLEKVYENALMIELKKLGLEPISQVSIDVLYDLNPVGYYYADIIVDNAVIIEVKAAESLCENHERQLLNYLKASKLEVGLLLNFGEAPSFKRKYFTNDKKNQSNQS